MTLKHTLITIAICNQLQAVSFFITSLGNGGIANYNNGVSQINSTPNGETFGIDLSNSSLFWISSDYSNNTVSINKSDLNGSNISVLNSFNDTGGLNLSSLSVSQNKVFWSDFNGMYNSNLDGSNITQLSNNGGAVDIHVSGNYIYWSKYSGGGGSTTGGSIYRSDLDGQNETALITTIGSAFDLDVANSKIWWNDIASDRIYYSDLDGSSVFSFAGLNRGLGFSVTSEGVYVLNSEANNSNITRFNLDGSGQSVVTSLNTFSNDPFRLVATNIPEPSSTAFLVTGIFYCLSKRNRPKQRKRDDLER